MPLKKRAHKGQSSSSGTFDESKFVFAAAYARFQDSVNKRAGLKERGFQVDPICWPDIDYVITSRQWMKFCQPLGAAAMTVVREFYANAKEATGYTTLVRGKNVTFNGAAIN